MAIESFQTKLSSNATISPAGAKIQRWSDFNYFSSGRVVNVATEEDVQATIQHCIAQNINFSVQSGGHGWSAFPDLPHDEVMINMRGLNQVTFNSDKTEATIQGGAIIKEVVDAAWDNDVHIVTGTCNEVGYVGALLGGGFGHMCAVYGLLIENVLSMNVVLADGSLRTIAAADEDLWFAFRGAGHNFGVVTSVTAKTHPVPRDQNNASVGALLFTEDKLEALIQAVEDLKLEPNMDIFTGFITSGPPHFTPVLAVFPFFYGPVEEARKAFASIIDLGPMVDDIRYAPYNRWNDGIDAFCAKGGRKPGYGVGVSKLVPSTWRSIWNQYVEFLEHEGTGHSGMLIEQYPQVKMENDTSSFPARGIRYNTFMLPWYPDATLDTEAQKLGKAMVDALDRDGSATSLKYVNHAFGDEPSEVVYGDRLDKLTDLKRKYDPENIFNRWFKLA
ncbi:FAD-binding domain-containing protein [Microthyrium microscopicum]|uniref:FAD-binding domain-containing protein n=1 Tax=Microthyrium microscopicum TaxID=703497 RepID=A0A6A6UIH6_9PEZI|nr:FAD-binding domain-containing protein [Microthyrium microscopicum]